MQDHKSTLMVRRVGGLIRQSAQRSLTVIVDGHPAGFIGEEISIEPGIRHVQVKTGFFTCRPLQVELGFGAATSLEYRSSWLAWASIGLGCFLVMALSFPAVVFLEQMKQLVEGDWLPPGIGIVLLLAFLVLYGWLAFAAPLQILAGMGIHSHTLTESVTHV